MEELDIRDLFLYFCSKIIYFMAIITVVVTIGCIYTVFVQKPLYTSKTSIILTGFSSNEQSTITQTDLNINSKLVSTYQEIVKSRRVLSQVIENLNLKVDTKELASMIRVGAVKDTEIIEISVTNIDNKEAYMIANEVAEVFSNEAKEFYNLSNVSILDYAEIETTPSNLHVAKQIVVYIVIGFVLAFVILFCIYYFDTTIKSAQEVEKKFELTILGSVPDYLKKKGGK